MLNPNQFTRWYIETSANLERQLLEFGFAGMFWQAYPQDIAFFVELYGPSRSVARDSRQGS